MPYRNSSPCRPWPHGSRRSTATHWLPRYLSYIAEIDLQVLAVEWRWATRGGPVVSAAQAARVAGRVAGGGWRVAGGGWRVAGG
ncbi:hypothetical protein, partial [Alicyclobacillus acidiphilus]|uniref:hypothetical protein n=1 Tax=Alicyclobacillus acidiphilus TaxID=182455 RepID=UPI001C3F4858